MFGGPSFGAEEFSSSGLARHLDTKTDREWNFSIFWFLYTPFKQNEGILGKSISR